MCTWNGQGSTKVFLELQSTSTTVDVDLFSFINSLINCVLMTQELTILLNVHDLYYRFQEKKLRTQIRKRKI